MTPFTPAQVESARAAAEAQIAAKHMPIEDVAYLRADPPIIDEEEGE